MRVAVAFDQDSDVDLLVQKIAKLQRAAGQAGAHRGIDRGASLGRRSPWLLEGWGTVCLRLILEFSFQSQKYVSFPVYLALGGSWGSGSYWQISSPPHSP